VIVLSDMQNTTKTRKPIPLCKRLSILQVLQSGIAENQNRVCGFDLLNALAR
jgi:hypothetical protein